MMEFLRKYLTAKSHELFSQKIPIVGDKIDWSYSVDTEKKKQENTDGNRY